MDYEIKPYSPEQHDQSLAMSIRAWTPVLDLMKPAVLDYAYEAFYPEGWQRKQEAEIISYLADNEEEVWVAELAGRVLGWIGIRIHPKDQMGETDIIAVDPASQRQGIASALMDHAMERMRQAGMAIVMVETDGDPGHAPARATYEYAGFESWPVARYFRKL